MAHHAASNEILLRLYFLILIFLIRLTKSLDERISISLVLGKGSYVFTPNNALNITLGTILILYHNERLLESWTRSGIFQQATAEILDLYFL
jgi:hypothetical protein